jgi:hypothetical protein
MARIIDKDTRLIDLDFGQLTVAAGRNAGSNFPDTVTSGGPGEEQLLNLIPAGQFNGGSFIQYVRVDLDYMVRNNEVMMPVEVSAQRTSPVPLGYSNNGNNFDQIEEFIFVFSRPLNNSNIEALTNTGEYENLRSCGLDGTTGSAVLAGDAGWPNQEQTIYAEKRMYSYSTNLGATRNNGELNADVLVNPNYNSLMGMPVLDNVSTWGSMTAITGPNLHCYRVVINRNQSFPGLGVGIFVNEPLAGDASCNWPAVSLRFLCKDPKFTEGEYLTRLANAMNNISEGGPVA